jgi:hypothetical protein
VHSIEALSESECDIVTVVGQLVISPYGRRNCLLASITDRRTQIAHRASKLPTQRVSRLPFPRCYAFPIEQPGIWHASIPFTLLEAKILGDLVSQPCQNYWQYSQTGLPCSRLV